MPAAPTPPKRTAKGQSIPRTEGEAAAMSLVTDRDIAAARKDWKARVKGPLMGLIDAKREPSVG